VRLRPGARGLVELPMIVEKATVLILGAGTSLPYKFPSGLRLLRDIQTAVQSPSWLANTFYRAGVAREQGELFAEAVQKCGRSSIHAFLEGRQDLARPGKLAIAAALIPYEKDGSLYTGVPDDSDIYRYMFSRLAEGCSRDDFRKHRLTIVTYNYDRSLEHYFVNAIKASYGVQEREAGEILRASLRVIHVHGQLGFLPWQAERGGRAYAPDVSADSLSLCAEHVKIISENDLDGGSAYDAARAALREAEVICILGFGYHAVNLQRLRVAEWNQSAASFGTFFGMSSRERQHTRNLLPKQLHDGHAGQGSVDLLRDIGPIL
jgi:hypothetical protein